MENDFIAYIQRLEVIAFFSGYPLIYFITLTIAGKPKNRSSLKKKLVCFLPISYSISGILFAGMQLKNLYPDYSYESFRNNIQLPWLFGWAILSILFWLPVFRRRPSLSLLHSLVFFSLILHDIYLNFTKSETASEILKNDMRVYTDSLLLFAALMCILLIIHLLLSFLKNFRHKN